MPEKIKKRNVKQKKIEIPKENVKVDYPVFCFRHLQTKPNGDYKFYCDFVQRLKMLCNSTWKDIRVAHKHGIGTEKMPINRIKPQLPPFVTPDVTDLIVFRANGDNRPFLGLVNDHIFHVIFLEETFNDVYDH